MSKSTKIMAVVLVIGALILAGGVAAAGGAQAAPAATIAPVTQQVNAGTGLHLDLAKYADLALKSFEGQLGIDDTKLNTAFTGAVSDTLDQVVKDGVITSAQAAQVNTFMKDGVTGLISKLKAFAPKFNLSQNRSGNGPVGTALSPASLAAAIGISSSDLETELKSGKSIADIAKEHNVDLQTLKNSVLAKAKSSLETAVSGGQLTQSQADQIYQALSQKLDVFASRPAQATLPARKMFFGKSLASLNPTKYANLFLTAFESRLGVDDAQLDAAFQAAVSDTVAQAVKDGAITAQQATQAASFAKLGVRQLAALAGKMPFGMLGGGRGPLGGMLQPAAIASALGMSSSDLEAQLKAGQSIADIAAAHHLDLAQVKQAILTQLKAELASAVQSGKLTQAMADLMYAKQSNNIDTLVTQSMAGLK